MKLMLYTLDNCTQISLEDAVCVLELCNRQCYSRMLRAFAGECFQPKEIGLFQKDKELSLDKDCQLLFNMIDIDTSEKSILTKLYKKLVEEDAFAEKSLAFDQLTEDIVAHIQNFISDTDLELTFLEELTVKDYLQLVKLAPAKAVTPLERLLDYIELVGELKLFKLLVLVQPKALFDDAEMQKIYRYSLYKNVKIVIIENTHQQHLLEYETKVYIDEDGFDMRI